MRPIILLLLTFVTLLLSHCSNELVPLPEVSVNPGIIEEGGTFTLYAKGKDSSSMFQWISPDNVTTDSANWTRTNVNRSMSGVYKVVQRFVIGDDTVPSDTVRLIVIVVPKGTPTTLTVDNSDVTTPIGAAPANDVSADTTSNPTANDDGPPPAADVKYCDRDSTYQFHFIKNGNYKLTIKHLEQGPAKRFSVCLSGACVALQATNEHCLVNGQEAQTWFVKVTGLCRIMSIKTEEKPEQVPISTDPAFVNGNILLWQSDNGYKINVSVEKVE